MSSSISRSSSSISRSSMSSSSSYSSKQPKTTTDDDTDDDIKSTMSSSSSSSSSSICRSLSLPPYLKRETCEVEDLLLTRLPPPNYLTAQAGNNVMIKSRFHDHPLILSTYLKENMDQKDKCVICVIYFTWGSPVYKCISECKRYIIFHKLCAELPRRITNLLHPEHPLQHFYYKGGYECVKCEAEIFHLGYECVVCEKKFALDVKCAFQDVPVSVTSSSSSLSRSLSFPLDTKQNSPIPRNLPTNVSLLISSFPKFQIQKKADQIQHFTHKKHPLILMSYFENFHSYDCIICDAEFLPDDLVYGCHECNFFLHKSCAEIVFPLTMRNTFHPAHLLERTIFLTKNTNRWVDLVYGCHESATCIICDKYQLVGCVGYNCALCKYIFCVECALPHIFEDHKEHKFIANFKEVIFTCDACGVTDDKERHSSVCTGCRLQVHNNCSNLFPPTVKQRRHPHTLHLTYFFQCGDDFADKRCDICYNKINNVYCMYQCTICPPAHTYITHVSCSTSKDIVETEKKDHIMPSSVDIEEKDQIMPNSIESTKEEGRQVKHFSHHHDLIYSSNVKTETDVIICDACVRPISCVPFYKCADNRCSFCLHKQCFELPRELQHPLHVHRLTLISPRDDHYFRRHLFYVQCYGCDIRCNGFVYVCEECGFLMDVRCSLLSYTLKHDSHHACTLSLVDYNRVHDQGIVDKAKCSACDCKCESHSLCKYSCERHNFHLDLGCALLPRTVAHDCPRHNWEPNRPLKLMYGAIKDASGIYFCDMCEKPRGENDWFYYCEDCKWSNHPHCVLGKVQLKYGKIYRLPWRRHRRHFKLVKISERLHKYFNYSCDKCGKPCKDSAFFCAMEREIFHVECASSGGVLLDKQDDIYLTVRSFLNEIWEQSEYDIYSEDDNIRFVREFLNEIWKTQSKGDYDIHHAVRVCRNGILDILIEGDDKILDDVRAYLNGFRRIMSKGDDEILGTVRAFLNEFWEVMGEEQWISENILP